MGQKQRRDGSMRLFARTCAFWLSPPWNQPFFVFGGERGKESHEPDLHCNPYTPLLCRSPLFAASPQPLPASIGGFRGGGGFVVGSLIVLANA